MGNVRVQDKSFDVSNLPILPSNIKEVVGEGPLTITDSFASLGALFKTTLYGPLDTWSSFWQNVGNRASLMSKQDRLEQYDSIKGPHDELSVGLKVYSEAEVEKLKAANKNLKAYEVLKTSLSEEDLKKIRAVLPKSQTDADIMISLSKIARDPKVTRDVRKLINQKLNEAAKNTKYKEYIPENPNHYRYQMLRRIAIATIVGLGIYYYNIPKVDAQEPEIETEIPTDTKSIWGQGIDRLYELTEKDLEDVRGFRNRTLTRIGNIANGIGQGFERLSSETNRDIEEMQRTSYLPPLNEVELKGLYTRFIQSERLSNLKETVTGVWDEFEKRGLKNGERARELPERTKELLVIIPEGLVSLIV